MDRTTAACGACVIVLLVLWQSSAVSNPMRETPTHNTELLAQLSSVAQRLEKLEKGVEAARKSSDEHQLAHERDAKSLASLRTKLEEVQRPNANAGDSAAASTKALMDELKQDAAALRAQIRKDLNESAARWEAAFQTASPPAWVSSEGNTQPEFPLDDMQRNWRHYLTPIPPLPADALVEEKMLRVLFEKYREDPSAKTNVPLYGIPCTHECDLVRNHINNIDTGLGHMVVIVARPQTELMPYFRGIERRFPGRFTVMHYPNGTGYPEAINIIQKFGFSITPPKPFVTIANCDLWPLPGWFGLFANYTAKRAHRTAVTQLNGFSHFSITRLGWEKVGFWDETIYPTYYDDDEYALRLRLLKLRIGFFPLAETHIDLRVPMQYHAFVHQHGGSNSGRDPRFRDQNGRSDRYDYLRRKWNFDLSTHNASAVFSHPFNISVLPLRHATFKDPAHRDCILNFLPTHPKLKNAEGGDTGFCFYNATNALAHLLPSGTEIPSWILNQQQTGARAADEPVDPWAVDIRGVGWSYPNEMP